MKGIENIEANAVLVTKRITAAKETKATKRTTKVAKQMASGIHLLSVIANRSAKGKTYTFLEHKILESISDRFRKFENEGHICYDDRVKVTNIVQRLRAQGPKRFFWYGVVTFITLYMGACGGIGVLIATLFS